MHWFAGNGPTQNTPVSGGLFDLQLGCHGWHSKNFVVVLPLVLPPKMMITNGDLTKNGSLITQLFVVGHRGWFIIGTTLKKYHEISKELSLSWLNAESNTAMAAMSVG